MGVWGVEELPVIMVVEDDDAVQGFVEEALVDGGFEPAIAASGEEAVTLLMGRLTKYRALVTDVNLLGNDGRLGSCQARQRDRPRISHYLHERGTRRRLGIQGRTQQHHVGEAFCARAACHGRFPASECRHAAKVRGCTRIYLTVSLERFPKLQFL